jgi:ketosteroid isomerase-like protein
VSRKQSVARKTIPLCGIVLVLGMLGCGFTIYTPQQTTYVSLPPLMATRAPEGNAKQELIAVIQKFLKEVPKNERATFDRFFADDVIYTRGTGQVITKKDILDDTENSSAPRANATYEGEDFQVHQYGNLAVVNFRLVMHATEENKPVTRTFRNTGTFMKRNGQWQAIAWQATPIAAGK